MKPVFLTILILLINQLGYAQQPNILWITIEDTSPQFIACYGNEDASTPVIDQLAEEGVRFTNAFSTGTVCSPSRSTIITGARTYAMGTGNHRSNYPVPDFIKGFPYYLKQAHYYVTNNSKTDYNVANEKAFIEEAWHESSNQAGWWNREPGQAFFSIFNYNESHQSRTMTNPYEWYRKEVYEQLPAQERIEEDEFDMPPFYHDSPEMRKQFARVYNSIKLTDNRVGELLDRLREDQLMDSTIIFFYADHGEGIPRGKTNGINLGYRVPFIVWFPPMYEHLSPWGTGTVTDELVSFEDLAPTIISLAGAEVPEHMKGRVLIGEDRDEPVDQLFLSSDRSDNGIDMVRTVTDGRYVYSRNYMPYMPQARYIRYMEIGDIKQQMRADLKANKLNELQQSLFEERPAEFLYDIESDLWETDNLVEETEHQLRIREMRQALEANILAQKDVLFLPEYEIGLISQSTTPYTFRQSASDYPLKEIYAAASLSGQRGESIMKQQLELLKHPNKIVRYWAAIGLRSQNKGMLKDCETQLTEAMQDDYPPVALTAAAIVYDNFSSPEATEKLKSYCKHKNNDLALMAINYLLYVQKPEPFVQTVREVKDNVAINYNVSAASKDFLGRLGLIPNTFEYK
ncbi:arylsulfatase A-like enzyme [Catalinimonas alkaloidigena]|uniref:sulfatase-like hydrolase/transferase n=1 Tax=Catalinimonas alkaloidigena TaxID=1075417 RepID=UPI002405E86C|nr:sulfatase-like hydrolase/transferase [Catalinimonas alkaloidigena]MDF9796459.1 arylsulfatase A-like enzyme [Catalinimonas alkaloidigena]